MTQPAMNSIDQAIGQVTDFHNVIGSPVASEPRLLPHDPVVTSEALMQMRQLLSQLDSARRDED